MRETLRKYKSLCNEVVWGTVFRAVQTHSQRMFQACSGNKKPICHRRMSIEQQAPSKRIKDRSRHRGIINLKCGHKNYFPIMLLSTIA
jgi:hypothetical protein